MKKIFILDDNEELLEIMGRLLSQEYQVQGSMDTERIVDEIVEFNPDLLLLDHSIGDFNSGDILAKLKLSRNPLTVPVVLFSAHPLLPEMAAVIGADGYIEKPSDINHIREYIRNILDK